MSTAINDAVDYTKGASRKDPETVECLELLEIPLINLLAQVKRGG